MKKLFTLALVLMLALSLAACGGNSNTPSGNGGNNSTDPPASQGGNSTTPSGNNGGTNIKDASIDNWQVVVKDYFGIDVSVPNGWTVDTAQSLNGKSDVTVSFIPGATTEWEAFAESIFNSTKAVTTNGIQGATNDTAYTSFADAKQGSSTSAWKYFYGTKNARVQVMVSVEYDDSISLSIDGSTK